MSEFTERLKQHQIDSLYNEYFSPIGAVVDCVEAAEVIERYEQEEMKREAGCDVCMHRRYFSNGGVFSRISIHQDIHGNYIMSCGNETVPVYVCPKCGRKLRERHW